jgi:hypothetical protein
MHRDYSAAEQPICAAPGVDIPKVSFVQIGGYLRTQLLFQLSGASGSEPPTGCWPGVDAVVVSTDNTLT